MSAVYVEKGIALKQNQFEELKRRVIVKVMINLRKVTWWL